jgi:hypothetical protein
MSGYEVITMMAVCMLQGLPALLLCRSTRGMVCHGDGCTSHWLYTTAIWYTRQDEGVSDSLLWSPPPAHMTVELLKVLWTVPVLGRVDRRAPLHDHRGERVHTSCRHREQSHDSESVTNPEGTNRSHGTTRHCSLPLGSRHHSSTALPELLGTIRLIRCAL